MATGTVFLFSEDCLMKRRFLVCACALAALLACGGSRTSVAASIVVSTLDNPIQPGQRNQGWWSNSASNTHIDNVSISIGASTQFGTLRNYATFYLPPLPLKVTRA